MLSNMLYDHILDSDKKDHISPEHTFSPSAIGKCKRQIYYKKTNTCVSNPINSPALLKMKLGEAAHIVIQNYLRDMGLWIDGEELKEKTLYGINFRYRYDGKLIIKDKPYICEIKSIYGNGFYRIEKEPDIDHVKQVILYCLLEKINDAILLYVGRDNGRLLEYVIRIDNNTVYIDNNGTLLEYDNLLNDIELQVSELKNLFMDIDNNNPPEKLKKFYIKYLNNEFSYKFQKDKVEYESDWRCLYCPYLDYCRLPEQNTAIDNKFYFPVDTDDKV